MRPGAAHVHDYTADADAPIRSSHGPMGPDPLEMASLNLWTESGWVEVYRGPRTYCESLCGDPDNGVPHCWSITWARDSLLRVGAGR